MPFSKYEQRVPYLGMNQFDSPQNMSNLFVTLMENCVPYDTYIGNRMGQSVWNNAISEFNIIESYSITIGTDDVLIYLADNRIMKAVGATGVPVMLGTLNAIPTRATFVPYNNYLYLATDIENKIIDYTNEKIYRLGLPQAPAIANSELSVIASGSIDYARKQDDGTGTGALVYNDAMRLKYRYLKKYVREDNDGNVQDKGGMITPQIAAEATADMTGQAGNCNVLITIPFINDPDITHVYIYRTRGYDPSEEQLNEIPVDFFYVGKVKNTGTTFLDTMSDTILSGETDYATEFEFEPLPATGIMENIGQRIFVGNGNEIAYTHNYGGEDSTIYNPTGAVDYVYDLAADFLTLTRTGTIASTSGQIHIANGLPVSCLKKLSSDLYIGTSIKTYILKQANDSVLVELTPVPSEIGIQSHRGACEWKGTLVVQANENGQHGIRMIESGVFTDDIINNRLTVDLESISDYTKVCMAVFKDQLWMGCPIGSATNNYVECIKSLQSHTRGTSFIHWVAFRHTINMDHSVRLPSGAFLVFDKKAKTYLKQDSTWQDNGNNFTATITFKPILGNPSDIVQLINGKMAIDTDYYTQMEWRADEIAGQTVIYPEGAALNTWATAHWNIGDYYDPAQGWFKPITGIWELAFDTDCKDKRMTLTMKKADPAAWKFNNMEINLFIRSMR